MTITIYTGHVGSGKSYEVVKSVILPALKAGRSVVSNIDGLDPDAINDWLERDGCEQPGKLIPVDRNDIKRADFFPVRQKDGSYEPSVWVPLGALVVVDECLQYWGSDKTLSPEHRHFFAEHRHICAEDGTACDLVLISQTVDSVHRSLRGLAQFQIDCRKLSALGLNRKYSTCTYEGARTRQAKKYVLGRETKTYDKRIFPLYSSFAVKNGRILQTDKRLTIWNNKLFWIVVVASPVLLLGSLGMLYHQFFGTTHVVVPGAPSQPGQPAPPPVSPVAAVMQQAVMPERPAPVLPKPASDIGGESIGPVSVWKIVGAVSFSGARYAVIRRAGFPLRYMPLSQCLLSYGRPVTCRVGEEVFEPETGPASVASPAGGPGGVWGPDAVAASSVKVH